MTATAVRRLPSLPDDRDLPGAAGLLSAAGATRVAGFLAGRGLEPLRVDPAQAHYRPGRWLTVCFRTASVDRASGRPVCLTVTVDCRPGEPEAVWAFPDDPSLPGLAAATDGRLLRRRLRPRPAKVVVEPLRYRPRRRAVLRYRLPDGDLFGKVVTAKRARRLQALGEALHTAESDLRLALPLGRVAPGALVLPCLAGSSLRDLLLTGCRLPGPDRLAGLPEQLHHRCLAAPAPGDGAARRRVDPCTALAAAQVVARLLPGEGSMAGRLAESVIAWADESDPPDEWIVHGDLYENQVLVDGESFGLIDLDDLGPGDPLLDAANFSAHLWLLGTSGTPAGSVILRFREELRTGFCRRFDTEPAALAWREAYCLLRLVGGPFRVLHPEWPRRMADRLALAGEALPRRRA
jgi:hypothetical protein